MNSTDAETIQDERYKVEQLQLAIHDHDKDQGQDQHPASSPAAGDYAGGVSKADPKEIALVRKLDIHTMPVLWVMYFMSVLLDMGPIRALQRVLTWTCT